MRVRLSFNKPHSPGLTMATRTAGTDGIKWCGHMFLDFQSGHLKMESPISISIVKR